MRRFHGKVAFITGAARGQGRSHAVRLAEEGADILMLDICSQIPSVDAPMPRLEDLEETARLVETAGRRVIARQADVRDFDAVRSVVEEGLVKLGPIDFVLANAGIFPASTNAGTRLPAFYDAVDVMIKGVFHTCEAAIPSMIDSARGGAIVITSSSAGLKAFTPTLGHAIPGVLGYTAAKHGVVGLMRAYANALAAHRIRCNTVHPTGVNTPMVVNSAFAEFQAQNSSAAVQLGNALPVQLLEANDVSDTILFLCSEEGKYITGSTIPVDAGICNR